MQSSRTGYAPSRRGQGSCLAGYVVDWGVANGNRASIYLLLKGESGKDTKRAG